MFLQIATEECTSEGLRRLAAAHTVQVDFPFVHVAKLVSLVSLNQSLTYKNHKLVSLASLNQSLTYKNPKKKKLIPSLPIDVFPLLLSPSSGMQGALHLPGGVIKVLEGSGPGTWRRANDVREQAIEQQRLMGWLRKRGVEVLPCPQPCDVANLIADALPGGRAPWATDMAPPEKVVVEVYMAEESFVDDNGNKLAKKHLTLDCSWDSESP
jgi:hypothetical protein